MQGDCRRYNLVKLLNRLLRAKLLRTLCKLDAAEADAAHVLEQKAGHRGASGELAKIASARALLQSAFQEQ